MSEPFRYWLQADGYRDMFICGECLPEAERRNLEIMSGPALRVPAPDDWTCNHYTEFVTQERYDEAGRRLQRFAEIRAGVPRLGLSRDPRVPWWRRKPSYGGGGGFVGRS